MTVDQAFATLAPIAISSISLVVAIVSFVMNYRLNKRGKETSEQLAEMQMRLHKLQLEKEEEAAGRRLSSKVEARHVPVGLKNHHIRISNTGGTTVTNVTCECDKDNAPYAFRSLLSVWSQARASMRLSCLSAAHLANSSSQPIGLGRMVRNVAEKT